MENKNYARKGQGKDTSSPLSMFDLTVKASEDTVTQTKEILMFMRNHAKNWCFQLEKGDETGYLHYQCRLSLVSKKRLSTMITLCKNVEAFKLGCHITPTSNPVQRAGNNFYVMKTDTRVDGPWKSTEDRYVDMDKICSYYQFEEPKGGWKPWQKSVMNIIDGPVNAGTVYVIINPGGSVGKTLLCNWLETRKKAIQITPGSDVEKIPRQVMNEEKLGCYIVDMPKTETKKVSANFWTGLELIAGGRACDDRYHYEKAIFNPPHVFLFTNNQVDTWAMTGNRWVFMTINKFYELGVITNQEYAFQIEQPKRLGRNDGKIDLGLPIFDPENMRQSPIVLNVVGGNNPTYGGLTTTKYSCPVQETIPDKQEVKQMLAEMDEGMRELQRRLEDSNNNK